MKLCQFVVFLGVCALTSAQLDGGGILGGGGAAGGGGMSATGAGPSAKSPVNTMLMSSMALADHSAMSLPAMVMMRQNPAMMSNPMGAFMMSNMLGVDVNKIATPMAMMNGMGGRRTNMMQWLPLMMGDPSTAGLMLSMGMGGMGAMGNMGGMMNPLSLMALSNF